MLPKRKRAVKFSPLKVISAIGLAVAFASAAQAQGTDAGRTVANTFTLDYSVNGTDQPEINNNTNPTLFTVDRLIDLTLAQTNSPLLVAPGTLPLVDGGGNLTPATVAGQPTALSYTLTNTGNDTQAYSFDVTSPTGTFAAANIRVFYEDAAGNFVEVAEVAAGAAAAGAVTDDIPAGESRTVFVVADIPAGATNAQFDDIILTAETRDPVNWAFEGVLNTVIDPVTGVVSTTPVAPIVPNATAGDTTTNDAGSANDLVNAAQNVFADGAGSTDAATDGLFSDTAQYIIAAPNLTGVKTVVVVATDGSAINCATDAIVAGNQFSTPGACVEYTITVTNNGADDAGGNPLAAADVLASGIDIVDVLPPELIFQGATVGGSFSVAPVADPGNPAAGAVCDGTAATCNVAFTNGELPGNPVTTGTIVIRAIVQ